MKNLSLNYEKRRNAGKGGIHKVDAAITGVSESSEKQIMREETRSDVQSALDALPFNLRAPLVFREYGDLSYREIGVDPGDIRRATSRCGSSARGSASEKALGEGDAYVS